MTVKVIDSVRAGKLEFARAVQAGPWVFLNGVRASGEDGALASGLADSLLPHYGKPKAEREARTIMGAISQTLEKVDAGPQDVVRLDQYFTDWQVVPHYHTARRDAFADAVPASTSILQPGLLLPGAEMEVQALARQRKPGEQYEFLTPSGLEVSPHMGFAPIVRTGDLIFFAGQMAEEGNNGIAGAAKVPDTHLWKGLAIRLETEYLIEHKLKPALEAVGVGPQHVVKAQVYLASIEDAPAFNEVWRTWFDGSPPVTTIIPTARPGFNCPDASIEVNLVTVPPESTPERVNDYGVSPMYEDFPSACKGGGLLFVSGTMALPSDDWPGSAYDNGETPYFKSAIEDEMELVVGKIKTICERAGASLEDAVRIIQFHTDLEDFYHACCVWTRECGERSMPITGIRVPEPLSVPRGRVLVEAYFYLSDKGAN